MLKERKNLVFLFLILLLQWLEIDAEEGGCNMNLIKNMIDFYGFPYVADSDGEIYPLSPNSPPEDDDADDDSESDDDSSEDEGFYAENDDNDSPQSGGSPHIHYHHHKNGHPPHHLPTPVVSKKSSRPCPALEQLRKLVARVKQGPRQPRK